MQEFAKQMVYVKVPISKARALTGRAPIGVRWVDVNKGDDVHPNMRSRLVARQIRGPGEESTFAPTPPLETLRSINCRTRSLKSLTLSGIDKFNIRILPFSILTYTSSTGNAQPTAVS